MPLRALESSQEERELKGSDQSQAEGESSQRVPYSMVVPKRGGVRGPEEEGALSDLGRKNKDITFIHPADNLEAVMQDVLGSERHDGSFCFLNEGRLRDRMSLFKEHFLPELPERKIIYAMKANPKPRILEILSQEGVDGFDCASIEEIREAIIHVGHDGIYFNHPIKKRGDIKEALLRGVSYYTVQSRRGIEEVLREAEKIDIHHSVEVALRVATPNEKAEIDLSSKYGCHPEEVEHLLWQIRKGGAKRGLSMNTGSQNKDPSSFSESIGVLASLAYKNGGVNSINLGGGIPVNYFEGDHHSTTEYLSVISDAVRSNMDLFFDPSVEDRRVIIEPGRSIVADSVDLVIPVLDIDERSGERRAFIDDGIFTSFSDRVIHNWQYNFDVYSPDGTPPSERTSRHMVYGRTCDSGDVIGKVPLPENLKVGDYLWVKNAGAYMDSQASRFNGFEPPSYVAYNTLRK